MPRKKRIVEETEQELIEEKDEPAPEGVTFDLSDGSGEPKEVTIKDGEIIKYPKLKKTIGIISWLPDNMRDARIARLNKTLTGLYKLFGDEVDYTIVAQNWKDYNVPDFIPTKYIYYYEHALGIANVRKTMEEKFLEQGHDYLIMFDDDALLEVEEGAIQNYLDEMDKHPDGFCFLQYRAAQLNGCAISRSIILQTPMISMNPQRAEGWDDTIYSNLLHYKHADKEFTISGVVCTQWDEQDKETPVESTWFHTLTATQVNNLMKNTDIYLDEFKKGNFDIENIRNTKIPCKHMSSEDARKWERIQKAIEYGWIDRNQAKSLKKIWELE